MPDDPNASFRRFAQDLRRVREDRDISLDKVQDATQVHSSHLESFEAGTLHEESRMNDVYLKAFVRAYAEAIEVPPDTVVEHLELALEGNYDEQLRRAFLDAPAGDTGPEKDSGSSGIGSEEDGAGSSSTAPSELDDVEAPTEDSDPAPGAEATEEEFPSDRLGDTPSESDSVSPASSRSDPEDGEMRAAPSDAGKEEAADTASDSDSEDSGPRTAPPGGSGSQGQETLGESPSRPGRWMAIGLFIVLLVGGGLGLYLLGGSASTGSSTDAPAPEEASQVSSADGAASDTAAADTTEAEPSPDRRPPPANLSLGDTLHVTVVATSDVREIRVQQDANLRRPYWIEEGEAMVFPFADRITLQNELDNLRLLLEGYPYPTSRTDEEGRVVIRRETAVQFADTLRGRPAAVPERPDTTWGDAPPSVADTLGSDTLSTAWPPPHVQGAEDPLGPRPHSDFPPEWGE